MGGDADSNPSRRTPLDARVSFFPLNPMLTRDARRSEGGKPSLLLLLLPRSLRLRSCCYCGRVCANCVLLLCLAEPLLHLIY